MVHNGIEYGMMQAYAEGFDILRNKDSKDLSEDERFALNMPDIAEVWRRGRVISSWLLDLGAAALYARFRSRQEHAFGEKMLSAMRFGFGGHIEGSEPTDPESQPTASQGHAMAQQAARWRDG